ncbi:Diguanylate cyclase [Candidatus Accumulibacter aalborgensis]|uniref:diguanylate cyclase n=1 Tax=Candidatus Accumulibacter aalborgensis TaxID=1860102 RepID=A0A1A8XZJ7_9PROT|nr:GGDEF domain-containing protein [Candidatus Accumulibacter aalborgensis]SBT09488.1 Diguanylate cyclase [Candidatus Accumulibacter aalborgensis]
MFKHDQLPLVHSSRHASRRLHRRSFAMRLFGQARAVSPTASSHTHVRHGGVSRPGEELVNLRAAEARIGELEEALSEARAAAFTDALTGALNRRGFEDAYRREVARARRHGSRLALALIDLDDFKHLNDTLGHQAGDEALVHLVTGLRAALRPSDILCRFGGEEFVVLLPETALPEAAAAISRFQRQFAARAVPGRDVVVTFSAGVVLQDLSESLADSIVRADTATYAAKRAGKNCVVTA